MNVQIRNCNNIVDANILIEDNKLNIKYAINGTGKSTISKAIVAKAENNNNELSQLTPYQYINDGDINHLPSVNGLPDNIKIAVFNEEYVNQYVFQEDELLKNSFEIFVKTEYYNLKMAEIERLTHEIHNLFNTNQELNQFISDLGEFITSFGRSQTIANNGSLARGLSRGNIIQNIPEDLEDYSVFLRNDKNTQWLKWQLDGHAFMAFGEKCPFCAGNLDMQREKIERVKDEYDVNIIKHLSEILALFERFGNYFSAETNARVREITTSIHGLDEMQKQYLLSIKEEANALLSKLNKVREMGFETLKGIDRLAETIPQYKIDMGLLRHLRSEFTDNKVELINHAIELLRVEVGHLQGAVNQQKVEIQRTIERNNNEINTFLANAGYNYIVSIDEMPDHTYKLLLKVDTQSTVKGAKTHLSYGERNAFALVMFMYQALHNQVDLFILDDPISSFDFNKKYAIMDMLFMRPNSLRGKTTLLLTHDFEPIIDTVYNRSRSLSGLINAYYLENNMGNLTEQIIRKNNILSSIKVANENIEHRENVICKLIYLRRLTEIEEGQNMVWELLSSILHKKDRPDIQNEENREMTVEEITEASQKIRERIPEFDYMELLALLNNNTEMMNLYQNAESNYEKLQIFRIVMGTAGTDDTMRKFINETYHVENDYLFQLNPTQYNTIPLYIVNKCDEFLGLGQ